mmetsp:Transcript_2471/g.4493  ORF Transcript_2471/g.4493 Transcript_2471/m.4493 type:complete len:249 (-) Transcript_2471:145-891(-)
MSFLPDISSGIKSQVYRVQSRGNLRLPGDTARSARPNLVNAKHATVSSKRQASIKAEIRQIKVNFENQCFKKGSKQRKAERQNRLNLQQYNWKKWLEKRNGKPVYRLTKREFRVFWAWYSSRREVNGSEHEATGGIRLDRAADDFIKIGLFDNFSDAIKFLKGVDTDDSGFISFEELMEALGDTSNENQVICMRKFVASLTAKQESKNEAKKKADMAIRKTASTCADSRTKLPSIADRDSTIHRMRSC